MTTRPVHNMRITATGGEGFNTGRPRYRVECLTCRLVVHEATTGPVSRVTSHFEGRSSYDRPMTKEELLVLGLEDPDAPKADDSSEVLLVPIRVTQADRKNHLAVLYNRPYDKRMGSPIDNKFLMEWSLIPAMNARLQKDADRVKWDAEKIYEKVPTEEGLTEQPCGHMGPGGYQRQVTVLRPREGIQDCNKSPTERCWYDDQQDPRWNFCVFCGEPHERK